MKILFFDTKSYDKESFDKQVVNYPDIEIEYLKTDLAPKTAPLAKGYDAVCAFVSSDVGTKTVEALHEAGVKLILMRCAGFNNVDLSGSRGRARHDPGSGSQPPYPQGLCKGKRK